MQKFSAKECSLLIGQRGQSLSAFAKSVGIDRSALSQFLAPGATRLPRAETLHSISSVCGVSLDWLLGLIANENTLGDKVELLEIQKIGEEEADSIQLLSQWHKEATGYKIRYVPASLPDLLRTEIVSQFEFTDYGQHELAAREEAARYQLTYLRRPETDMEVCMPLQQLEMFAHGEGRWAGLSLEVRREQLKVMAGLIGEMYPTFRLFLFDERKLYVSPYTVFGPKRAAIYLGNMYLVINSAEHIKALSEHFDNLIRIASIGPDRAEKHILSLMETI